MAGNANDVYTFAGISTAQTFRIKGGYYGMTIHSASYGTGTVTLSILAADNATYLPVQTETADAFVVKQLPPGTYQIDPGTITDPLYFGIASIPTPVIGY